MLLRAPELEGCSACFEYGLPVVVERDHREVADEQIDDVLDEDVAGRQVEPAEVGLGGRDSGVGTLGEGDRRGGREVQVRGADGTSATRLQMEDHNFGPVSIEDIVAVEGADDPIGSARRVVGGLDDAVLVREAEEELAFAPVGPQPSRIAAALSFGEEGDGVVLVMLGAAGDGGAAEDAGERPAQGAEEGVRRRPLPGGYFRPKGMSSAR